MKELLTIAEFAELVGVSKQALYKQAKSENSKLAPFIETQGKMLFIKASALKEVYGVECDVSTIQPTIQPKDESIKPISTPIQPQEVEEVEKVKPDNQPHSTPIQPILEQVIAALQGQLEEKDRQISRLQEQAAEQAAEMREKDKIIQDQLTQMNELLRNSQMLQAQANKYLLASTEPQDAAGEPQEVEVIETQAAEQAAAEGQIEPIETQQEPVEEIEPPEAEVKQEKKHGRLYNFFFGDWGV